MMYDLSPIFDDYNIAVHVTTSAPNYYHGVNRMPGIAVQQA